MSKKLVAYFSAGGVTAKAAKELAGACGADLYEIKPEVPYTGADLDWMNKKSRSSVEMNDPSSRPVLADASADIAEHDVIYEWKAGCHETEKMGRQFLKNRRIRS